MAPAPAMQVGPLIGHHDAPAGTSDAGHFSESKQRIAEVDKATDAQHRIERLRRERKVLAFSQGQEQAAPRVAVPAAGERPAGNVHAGDVQRARQQGDVLTIADADFQQCTRLQGSEVPEDLPSRAGQSALHLEKELLERPESGPAVAVVEIGSDAVLPGEGLLHNPQATLMAVEAPATGTKFIAFVQ